MSIAASTISRRTDEDLLNRSLLDSIEAETLSERVEHKPLRDVSSPQSFTYPISPQSPQSLNPLQFSDMFANTHEDFQHRQTPVGLAPAPPFNSFSFDQRPTRSATLSIPPQSIRDQRFQNQMESFGLPRQFDHRVDGREYTKAAHYPPPHFQPSVVTNSLIHHHTHRDEEISTIFVVGFPDDMQVNSHFPI